MSYCTCMVNQECGSYTPSKAHCSFTTDIYIIMYYMYEMMSVSGLLGIAREAVVAIERGA